MGLKDFKEEVEFAVATGIVEYIVDRLTGMFVKKKGNIFLLWPSWMKDKFKLKTARITKEIWKKAIEIVNKFDEFLIESIKKFGEEEKKSGAPGD